MEEEERAREERAREGKAEGNDITKFITVFY